MSQPSGIHRVLPLPGEACHFVHVDASMVHGRPSSVAPLSGPIDLLCSTHDTVPHISAAARRAGRAPSCRSPALTRSTSGYLAMTLAPGFKSHSHVRTIGASALWIGVSLFAAHQGMGDAGSLLFRIVSFDRAVALPAMWLVAWASQGIGRPAGRVLELSPVRHLGTISYRIDVYHPILPDLLPGAARWYPSVRLRSALVSL